MRLNDDHSRPSNVFSARRVQPSRSSMSLGARILIAATVVGFGVLHILGGTMLRQASASPSVETTMLMNHGD
jgi:hypothetical protein